MYMLRHSLRRTQSIILRLSLRLGLCIIRIVAHYSDLFTLCSARLRECCASGMDDIHPVKSNNTAYLPRRISRSPGKEETDIGGPHKLGEEDIRNGALEGRQVCQMRTHSSRRLGL